MSHFTRVRTQITDKEMLKRALTDLKHPFAEHAVVRGYQGQKQQAELVVTAGKAYDVGFDKASDGTYQVVADWWGVAQDSGLNAETFMQPVTQRYAYHKVVAEVAKQGFQVVQEATGTDNTVRVTVRRWT